MKRYLIRFDYGDDEPIGLFICGDSRGIEDLQILSETEDKDGKFSVELEHEYAEIPQDLPVDLSYPDILKTLPAQMEPQWKVLSKWLRDGKLNDNEAR